MFIDSYIIIIIITIIFISDIYYDL